VVADDLIEHAVRGAARGVGGRGTGHAGRRRAMPATPGSRETPGSRQEAARTPQNPRTGPPFTLAVSAPVAEHIGGLRATAGGRHP
jgi:hypothetical protein